MNVGDTFLGYTVEAQLGEGGNGYTYLVSKEGGEFTLKELRLGFKQGYESYRQGVEMFDRECRALRSITHPLVPQFVESHIDKTTTNHKFFLVSEFVPGETLATTVRQRQLSLEDITRLALNMTSVFEHIHGFPQPIIHRDVKPENIIISPDGFAHLIDFGSVNAAVAKSINFTTAGTFGYSAFESLCGGDAYPESDMYALGATLLHVLSGGRDIRELIDRLHYTPKIKGHVPVEFEPILERMMAKDYMARASVAEVRDFFSRREVVVGELVDDDTSVVIQHSSEGDRRVREEWIQRTLDKEKNRSVVGMLPHTPGRVSSDLEVHGGTRSVIVPIINHPKMPRFEEGAVSSIIPTVNPDLPGSIIRHKVDTAPMDIVAIENGSDAPTIRGGKSGPTAPMQPITAEDGLEGAIESVRQRHKWPEVDELDGIKYRTGEILRACCEVLFPQGRGVPIYRLVPDTFVPIETKISTAYKARDLTSRFKEEVVTWRLRANIIRDNTIDREQSYLQLVRDNRGLIRRGVQRLGHYDDDSEVIMTMRVHERRRTAEREGGNNLLDYLIDYQVLMEGDLSFCVNKGKEKYQKGKFNYPDIAEGLRKIHLPSELEPNLPSGLAFASPPVRFIFNNGVLYKNLNVGESHAKDGLQNGDLDGFYPAIPKPIYYGFLKRLEQRPTPNVSSILRVSTTATVPAITADDSLEKQVTGGESGLDQGGDLVPVELLSLEELEKIGLPHKLSVERGKKVLSMYADALIPRAGNQVQIHNLSHGEFIDVDVLLSRRKNESLSTVGRVYDEIWRLRVDIGEQGSEGGNLATLSMKRDMRGFWSRNVKKTPSTWDNMDLLLHAQIYERVVAPTKVMGPRVEYLVDVVQYPEIVQSFITEHVELPFGPNRYIRETFSLVPNIGYFVFDGLLYENATKPKDFRPATLSESELAAFFPTIPKRVYDALGKARNWGVSASKQLNVDKETLGESVPILLAVNPEPMTRAIADRDLTVTVPNGSVTGGEEVSKSLAMVPANSSEGAIVQTTNDDLIARIQGVARKFVDGMFPRARGMVTNPDNMWLPDVERIVGPSLLDLQENNYRKVSIPLFNNVGLWINEDVWLRAEYGCRTSDPEPHGVAIYQDSRSTIDRVFNRKRNEVHFFKQLMSIRFFEEQVSDIDDSMHVPDEPVNYLAVVDCNDRHIWRSLQYKSHNRLLQGIVNVNSQDKASHYITRMVMHGAKFDVNNVHDKLGKQKITEGVITSNDLKGRTYLPEDPNLNEKMTRPIFSLV